LTALDCPGLHWSAPLSSMWWSTGLHWTAWTPQEYSGLTWTALSISWLCGNVYSTGLWTLDVLTKWTSLTRIFGFSIIFFSYQHFQGPRMLVVNTFLYCFLNLDHINTILIQDIWTTLTVLDDLHCSTHFTDGILGFWWVCTLYLFIKLRTRLDHDPWRLSQEVLFLQ